MTPFFSKIIRTVCVASATLLLYAPAAGAAPHAGAGRPHRHKRPPVSRPNKPVKLHGDAGRAQDAYSAMQKAFYLPKVRLYRGNPYSYLWPFSQALAGTISMAGVPHAPPGYRHDVAARLVGLRAYFNSSGTPRAYEGGVATLPGNDGRVYYDDNEWVGLELVRASELVGRAGYLVRARELFDSITAAWSADPNQGCPGGVPFSSAADNDQRNVVTDGPGAELGVRLYQLTRDPSTLDWARRMYDWVRSCLPAGGDLYADHVNPRGLLDTTMWSYNQGVMIGAGVMLYQATGEMRYLADARRTASAALDAFGLGVLAKEPPFFVSVFVRNLLLLNSVRPDRAYVAAARAYASWAYRHVRQRRSGLYAFGPGGGVQLLDQAALVNIWAQLASPARLLF